MRKLSEIEVKEKHLEILEQLDKFIKEHDISMMLGFGSLLGAVRHSGMIPWNDDIDIFMLRNEYEKFIKFDSIGNYLAIHSPTNSKTHLPFTKVYDKRTTLIEDTDFSVKYGVNVDIFPIDNYDEKYLIAYLRIQLLRNIIMIKTIINNEQRSRFRNILLKLLKLVFLPFSVSRIAKKINKISLKVSKKSRKLRGCLVWGYSKKTYVRANAYDNLSSVLFEKLYMSIPSDYDVVLAKLYGNYMVMPAKEKQKSSHHCEVYIDEENENEPK